MRAKIYNSKTEPNRVFISYNGGLNEYFVPMSGGYVRDENGLQICEKLLRIGNTLKFNNQVNGNNFINFIRKQWVAYRRYYRGVDLL